MTTLPETDPYENPVVEFDFSDELDAVDSAAVSITTAAGRDVNAATVLSGALQITGTSVFQRVIGGVNGTDYKLRCEAVRGSDQRVRTGLLPVRRA